MEEGYRIPAIEEFVQGFEFEWQRKTRFVILDASKPEEEKKRLENDIPWNIEWIPARVFWKHDPSEMLSQTVDGIEWKFPGSLVNSRKPFDEQFWIDQGLVRVKI